MLAELAFAAVDESRKGHTKRQGELLDRGRAGVLLAPLQLRDVPLGQTGATGKLGLRKAGHLSESSEGCGVHLHDTDIKRYIAALQQLSADNPYDGTNYRLLSLLAVNDPLGVSADQELDWKRFGMLVRERRNSLRLVQGSGGVSAATWRKIEKAERPPYRDATLMAVCRTLGWTHDSYKRVLQGEDPIEERPAQAPSLEERVAALEADVLWIKGELRPPSD